MTAFEFLAPSPGAVARSPMEGQAQAAGARFEVRDGWSVAVSYPTDGSLTWVDLSHLRKVEVHGRHDLVLGQASRANGGWWCPVTRDRTLVIGDGDAEGLDVTCSFAALSVAGPGVREVFARFCALDLRERENCAMALRLDGGR